MERDHGLAREKYEKGCKVDDEYVRDATIEMRQSKEMNCRRVSNPALLHEEAGLVAIVPARERLARARTLADAGDIDQGLWLAASVARSVKPGAPIAEGAALSAELAMLQWKKSVEPLVDLHHYIRAVSAAEKIIRPLAAGPERENVLQLVKSAVEHHQQAAGKSTGSMAALHRAIAHRFDTNIALDPVPKPPAPEPPPRLPARLLLATLGTDCGFLRASPLSEAGSDSGLPVRFKLACKTTEKTYSAETEHIEYTETATRPAKKLETREVTTTETYFCGEGSKYWDRSAPLTKTCTRNVTKTEKYLVDVMEEYEVPKTRSVTTRESLFTLVVSGTVAFGTGSAIPFSFSKGRTETEVETPTHPLSVKTPTRSLAFGDAEFDFNQRGVYAAAREDLVDFLRKEVAKRVPAKEAKPAAPPIESTFVTDLYLNKGTPAEATWLDEQFGVTPEEMQRLLDGRKY